VQSLLEERVSLDHQEEGRADEDSDRRRDVALSTVLGARASHEILFDDNFAVLVLAQAKHGRVVEQGVDDSAGANEVARPGDGHPQILINEQVLNLDKYADQDGEYDEEDGVLGEDGHEGLLELDLVVEALVDEVEHLLGLVR